jgi:hypothetical protein
MAETKEILWDTERLAQFANADGRDEVERFRAGNDGFFPPGQWEAADLPMPGELFFGVDFSGLWRKLLGASDEPNPDEPKRVPRWWGFQQVLRRAWQESFPPDLCVILISSFHGETPFHVWPYQRAVMFLGVEPWRARFCGVCGKRFVADRPRRLYCSNACSGKARGGSRAASWRKHGEKWRARYEKKKAKRKVKGKSSGRARR